MVEEKMTTICGSLDDLPRWIGQKEDGMFVRKAIFKSNKSDTKPVRILNFADVHLNYTNEEDFENEEVMYSKERRTWNADAASVPALIKAMKYGEQFDRVVITGDVMDYLTCGCMELMDKYIWEKDPNVIVTLGGHELTRQMQTGRPNMTTLEERQAIVEKHWRHDMYYLSEVLGDKVMLIQLDNSCHRYWDFQIEKLSRDIELAREKGYIVLVFQHEGISTGKLEDAKNVFAIRESDGAGNNINFYNNHVVGHIGESDKATREVYKLLTENADVIKGFFCGHYHSAYYTEVKGSYLDANGERKEALIPQYAVEGLIYDDYVGHVMEITVE